MNTLGTACDGREECLDGEDEMWICTSKTFVVQIVLVCLGFVVAVVVGLRYREFRRMKKKASKVVRMSSATEKLMKTLETENFTECHDRPEFWKKLNVVILLHKWLLPERLRIQTSKMLYWSEVEHQEGNEAEAKNCLKKNLHRTTYKIVLEDQFPGIMRKHFHWLEQMLDYLENHSVAWWVLSKVRQVFVFYLDLFKDFYIANTILYVSGGLISLFTFPNTLPAVVFYCFLMSIIFPLLLSSHVLGRKRIEQLGASASRKEKILTYTKTMALSILNPMLIIHQYESKKEKMKSILKNSVDKEEGVDVDSIIKLLEEQDDLKKQYLEFLRTDLGFETIYQTAGQTILLFLAAEDKEESTATTGGLEKIFEADLLTISVLLSIKTCVSLHCKCISLEKPFFPITSKIFLHILTLFSVCKRIFVLVVFFVPSFGLFRLLVHWNFEQFPFAVRLNRNIRSDDLLYISGKSPVLWSEVDR